MKRRIIIPCILLGLWVTAQADPTPWKVDCGEKVTIKATPKSGFEFAQWTDGNTENPREVTVFEAQTYTAQFKPSTATAVDEVNEQTSTPRKVLIKDKLYILLDDKLYDATGKRVR